VSFVGDAVQPLADTSTAITRLVHAATAPPVVVRAFEA
jgi:hypothetical protein